MKLTRSNRHKSKINSAKTKILIIISAIVVIVLIPIWLISLFYTKEVPKQTNKNHVSEDLSETPIMSFKDDALIIPEGEIRFNESKFIESDVPVVVIDFEYTNKTEKNQNPETIIQERFTVEQEVNGAIEPMGYYTLKAEDPYYEEIQKSKNDVLPGKTTVAAFGFTLKERTAPLKINFIDNNKKIIGTKEITYSEKLAKYSADQEMTSSSFSSNQEQANQSNEPTNWDNGRNREQEAQDKFWEAKGWGWSDEKASAYADGRELEDQEQAGTINSEADAVNLAIATYGDNDGDWTWGSMGPVDGGYFVKAISTKGLETTMTGTAKSIVVYSDGTISEN